MITLRVAVSSYSIPEKISLFVNGKEIQMYYIFELSGLRIYEYRIQAPDEGGILWYSFYGKADGEEKYYGNNDRFLGGAGALSSNFPAKQFQITVYEKDFKTPDWIKNAVVYQIFPDRFFRAGETPFHGIERKWGEEPYHEASQFGGEYLSNDFFGGTLKGIEEKLPYLADLGITAVYLNPIFKAFSNHRYDTGDYEKIDETLGTNEDFIHLCETGEKYGIRFILDGVFSHTGADSRYFNRYGSYDSIGAYQSEDSPYHSWYSFKKFPDEYDSWWGFITLPNTRELDEGYSSYILTNRNSIIKQWLRLGASGWRLDVADELPDEFIMRLRKAAKEENPDAVVIGEVWEDASNKVSYGENRRFLLGKSLDGVMNYVFRGAVLDYLTLCDSALFVARIESMFENYPAEALYASLSLISTHDVPRALTILSDAPNVNSLDRAAQKAVTVTPEKRRLGIARLKLAVALQMTMPGAACVYYGDEAGMYGYADPFNRRTFDWDNINSELYETHKKFIALRAAHPALRTGDLNAVYSEEESVCFIRFIEHGKDKFGKDAKDEALIICVNASPTHETNFNLELGRFGMAAAYDAFIGEKSSDANHHLPVLLPPLSVKVFTLERSPQICTTIEYLKD
ncbi:MAG: glycoside hydrolase family 13 protein [Clostridia bacterium]|nr:glycoside hydrolase family 13 protein [Clostridia bacterium]